MLRVFLSTKPRNSIDIESPHEITSVAIVKGITNRAIRILSLGLMKDGLTRFQHHTSASALQISAVEGSMGEHLVSTTERRLNIYPRIQASGAREEHNNSPSSTENDEVIASSSTSGRIRGIRMTRACFGLTVLSTPQMTEEPRTKSC